jgi:hypothetical protein
MPDLDQKISTLLSQYGIRGVTSAVLVQDLKKVFGKQSNQYIKNQTTGTSGPMYKRRFYHLMAYGLILLYNRNMQYRMGYFRLTEDLLLDKRQQADFSKMKYWGLIEQAGEKRHVQGGRLSSNWRITNKGIRFIKGEIKIPRYAKIINGKCVGFHGKKETIKQIIEDKFSYEVAMTDNKYITLFNKTLPHEQH